MQRSPISPISARRAAALAEQGLGRPYSTLVRRTPIAASTGVVVPMKRPTYTGPDSATRNAVMERDQRRCAGCGRYVSVIGERGFSLQHRLPRRSGGSRRPGINMPPNLILVCGRGGGLPGCHGWMESHRTDALDLGWLLHDRAVPSQSPMFHALFGWVLLTDDARAIQTSPPMPSADGPTALGQHFTIPDGAA